METFSPVQKLDEVLKFLATSHFAKAGIILSDILKKLQPKIQDGDELLRILDKLIDDNFVKPIVRSVEWLPDSGTTYYKITFTGSYQYSLGGYQQIMDSQNAESIRIGKIEHSAKVNQTALTCLTAIVALGTLIAAIYYLTELYWKYHWFH